MIRSNLVGVLVVLAMIAFTSTAHAQPAFALGKPLPAADLPTGTVSVRVVAGSTQSAETNADVTLVVNGAARQARTGADGRATFGGLPAGATVQAKILDADKKEVASDEAKLPAQGGLKFLMTTKPFKEMAGTPSAPMAAGMPEARQLSGQPRPDGGEKPGVYSVRLTYNNLTAGSAGMTDTDPPKGALVHLVGFGADDSVSLQSRPVDAEGLAKFEGLDQTGGTSYFALASLRRGADQSIIDRLVSVVVVLDSRAGVRVVLSGEKRDATTPGVDDYSKLVPRDGRVTEPGKVRITLDGVGQPGMDVRLVDIATKQVIGTAKTAEGPPDPTQIQGGARFDPKADIPAGTVDIHVRGGKGQALDPLADVRIQLVAANGQEQPVPIEGAVGATGADGKVRIAIPGGKAPEAGVIAMVLINGKDLYSSPMDLTQAGGVLELSANWPSTGRPEAMLDAPRGGIIAYAETTMSGQTFRSLPIELIPGAGVHANIYIYPRTLFSFDTHSFVEDQLLAIQGTFEITNYSWAPYKDPKQPDGYLIKLPAGYKGAVVAPQDQNDVAVATGEGFRITRPIPPGGKKFRAGFSMPIVDGAASMKLELPIGTWGSALRIRQTPGMSVKLPPGITGETKQASSGEPWFVIENIRRERREPFLITVSGFPREPAWRIWAPRLTGIAVLLMILAGVALALSRRTGSAPVAADAAKRERLMEELVALEKKGIESSKDRQRREHLIDELERTWGT